MRSKELRVSCPNYSSSLNRIFTYSFLVTKDSSRVRVTAILVISRFMTRLETLVTTGQGTLTDGALPILNER